MATASPPVPVLREKALTACAEDGVQVTDMRLRVLDDALASAAPIRAYEVMDRFARAGRPAKPPSVYRALDFWVKRGVLHRVESLNAFAVCAGHHHAHEEPSFFLCDGCGAALEASGASAIEALKAQARTLGFQIERLALEAHGLCAECAAQA
jgi:Fur family transcriptional regulator, zinc uptake regulator